MFLVYVNDVKNLLIQGKSYLFADDTALFFSSQSIHLNALKAQSDLILMNDFLTSIDLELNVGKTKVMHFGTAKRTLNLHPQPTLYINGEPILTVSSFRYLGLTLDSNLTWIEHMESVKMRTKPIVGLMYRTRHLLPRETRNIIYHSMFHSILSYMIELYGASSNCNLIPLQRLQNLALRNIWDIPFDTPRVQLYRDIAQRVLPIRAVYETALCICVQEAEKGDPE